MFFYIYSIYKNIKSHAETLYNITDVLFFFRKGWSGGAMVLGRLPVPGRPTIWMTVGQEPFALAVGAGGSCLAIYILLYLFSPLSPSLWETARYRLKYCLKGPLNPKQSTNQLFHRAFLICFTFVLSNLAHSAIEGKQYSKRLKT